MNIAMEQTEVRRERKKKRDAFFIASSSGALRPRPHQPLNLDPPPPPPQKTKKTQEYVNGQLKNKYGDAFIRGNNVLYISTDKGASSS